MLMKKNALRVIAAMALMVPIVAEAAGDTAELLTFNQNSYVGWSYSRPNFKLDTDAISANKVNLYKASNGTDYTLTSPLFNCDGYKVIVVTSTLYCSTVSAGTYDLSRGYPTFELIGTNGDKLAATDHVFDKAEQYHEGMVTNVAVPDGTKQARLRLAAWNADMNSPVTVRELSVAGSVSGVEAPLADVASVTSGTGWMEIKASLAGSAEYFVYSSDAALVKRGVLHGMAERVDLPSGFYVVKVGNEAFRVIVR